MITRAVPKTCFRRSGSPFPMPTVMYRLMADVTVFITSRKAVTIPLTTP